MRARERAKGVNRKEFIFFRRQWVAMALFLLIGIWLAIGQPLQARVPEITDHTSELVEYFYEWGDYGSRPGELIEPTGIAISKAGVVAVADRGNSRVQLFKLNGEFVKTVIPDKPEKYGFKNPESVAFTSKGDLVVADTGNHQIKIFDQKGVLRVVIGKKGWKNGYFMYPKCVTVDSRDHIFTVEPRAKFISGIGLDFFQKQRVQGNRAQEFDLEGTFIQRFGHMHRIGGRRIRQLGSPFGMVVVPPSESASGTVLASSTPSIASPTLWFADTGNHRVLKWMTEDDAVPLHPLRMNDPMAIHRDAEGDLYVADTHHHRLLILDSEGTLKTWFGRLGSKRDEFSHPREMDSVANRLFVCDSMNHRVVVYKLKKKAAPIAETMVPKILWSDTH